MSVFTSASGQLSVTINGVTSPQIDNINLTLANTEYTIALPVNCRQFMIRGRKNGLLKLRYTSGGDYFSIPTGTFFSTSGISVASLTIYVESSVATQVLEVETWT